MAAWPWPVQTGPPQRLPESQPLCLCSLQLDLYTLFKEVYALWVGLGQYTGGEGCAAVFVLQVSNAEQGVEAVMGQADLAPAALLPPHCNMIPIPNSLAARLAAAELRAEDVVAELIDLLRPADPRHITATDLERCGAGGTVVSPPASCWRSASACGCSQAA